MACCGSEPCCLFPSCSKKSGPHEYENTWPVARRLPLDREEAAASVPMMAPVVEPPPLRPAKKEPQALHLFVLYLQLRARENLSSFEDALFEACSGT